MKPKFKVGDKVTIKQEGEKYFGKIYVVDDLYGGYRYDIMCYKPKKILIKHVYEDGPDLKRL